jgi:hypothetical protein
MTVYQMTHSRVGFKPRRGVQNALGAGMGIESQVTPVLDPGSGRSYLRRCSWGVDSAEIQRGWGGLGGSG